MAANDSEGGTTPADGCVSEAGVSLRTTLSTTSQVPKRVIANIYLNLQSPRTIAGADPHVREPVSVLPQASGYHNGSLGGLKDALDAAGFITIPLYAFHAWKSLSSPMSAMTVAENLMVKNIHASAFLALYRWLAWNIDDTVQERETLIGHRRRNTVDSKEPLIN